MTESRELNRRAVGEWIKVRRKARNMTQVALGEAWGVSQAMICQVESGRYEVNMSRFLELCGIFEIDPVLATDQIEALAANSARRTAGAAKPAKKPAAKKAAAKKPAAKKPAAKKPAAKKPAKATAKKRR